MKRALEQGDLVLVTSGEDVGSVLYCTQVTGERVSLRDYGLALLEPLALIEKLSWQREMDSEKILADRRARGHDVKCRRGDRAPRHNV